MKILKAQHTDILNKLTIGIVNHEVNIIHSLSNMIGDYKYLNIERKNLISKILNEGLRNKCDLIVFPEVSIPWQWMNTIREFSQKNDIGVICGLEHQTNNKETVYNYCLVILPQKSKNGFRDCYINRRNKIHYSPKELEYIRGKFLHEPTLLSKEICIFYWKAIYFTVFNCYELADISLRANLAGKVDLIFAIEFNKDVNYFSSIVESLSRDVHCYVVQVNSSKFGDSRIIQPSNSQSKDILKIKGGSNSVLITGEVDIQKLRKFQSIDYNLQQKNNLFKTTPPDYKIELKRKDLTF